MTNDMHWTRAESWRQINSSTALTEPERLSSRVLEEGCTP